MTNNSNEDTSKKLHQQKDQKPPLIPPAKIRTSSSSLQINKQPQYSSNISSPTNEQNMKPREASNLQLGTEVWSSIEDLFWVSLLFMVLAIIGPWMAISFEAELRSVVVTVIVEFDCLFVSCFY